jgi:hypothetical protein
MNQQELKQIVISGCKFRYKSYDFKKAKSDFISIVDERNKEDFEKDDRLCSDYMPKELKEKYLVWRDGKVWDIELGSNGTIYRYKVGVNKMFAKTFYCDDMGVSIFPL